MARSTINNGENEVTTPMGAIPKNKSRIAVDVNTDFRFEIGGWLAAAYPEVGSRVELANVIRALLAELVTSDEDTTRADAMFAAKLRTRVLERVKTAQATPRSAGR